jgi:PAS domain S-box-containing protein
VILLGLGGALIASSFGRVARSERALRESEQRFCLLVSGIENYAILMLDPEGRVLLWNEGAERIKGYKADEIIGKHFSCFYEEEDFRSGLPERGLEVARTTGSYSTEGWRVRKDGSRFLANILITAIRDDSGTLRGFAKLTHDITERKEAEKALARETEERQRVERILSQAQKMDVLGQLTGGIAHDFNNMLAVIVGSLDILQRRLRTDDPRILNLIRSATQAADRSAALTHGLLAFSRQQTLEPRPMDANRLISGMSALLNRTLGESIGIETVLAAGLWTTLVDVNQLESAVLNLAVNARDASQPEAS